MDAEQCILRSLAADEKAIQAARSPDSSKSAESAGLLFGGNRKFRRLMQQPFDEQIEFLLGQLFAKRRHGIVAAVESLVSRIAEKIAQPLSRTVAGQIGRPRGALHTGLLE